MVAEVRANTNVLGAAPADLEFRKLAEHIPTLCWIADAEGYITWYNPKWYDYTGTTPSDMEGWGWRSVHDPKALPDVLAQWKAAISAARPFEMVFSIRGADGVLRPFLTRIHPAFDARGTVTNWYGVNTDIEDIVRARTLVERSHGELEALVGQRTGERNLLATLVEHTDVMVMALDADYRILAINRANIEEFQRIYGPRPKVGDNMLDLLAGQPEQQAISRAAWARAIAGEEYTVVETRGDPARARSDYEIKFRTLRTDTGQRIGAFQFVTDITQRLEDQRTLAQARESLLQAQKLEAMGQLTGGVAHDFNNLLTPILGALDVLARRGVGGDREQRLIHGARESAERARTLVHRLLAFARRQPLQSGPVDVGGLVRGMADLVASAAGPAVAVTLEVADPIPLARADRHQLEMAILNLGVNARDAMDGAGRLTISVTAEAVEKGHPAALRPGPYVRICVSDTGKGMDEATRARAVEPFFSTKGVGQGTGLGLSMAHGLASQLGGALTIDSRPGEGARIAIWLPQSVDPVLSSTAPRRSDVAPAYAGIVLLVDDEAYIRDVAAEMLTELGFQVHESATPEAALAAVDAGLELDILVTDHLMPGMTGVELAYAVQARRPGARALIISGFADVESLDAALPRLSKPFVQSDLAAALAELRLGR